MSVLDLARRQTVQFNPANIEHRKIAVDFFRNGNWSSSPVQFAVPYDSGDVLAHVTNELAAYYLQKEFESGRKARK
jgi:hypothetical protein